MTIQLLLDLEQQFRDEAEMTRETGRLHTDILKEAMCYATADVIERKADQVAAVRRTLEARLEGLPRWKRFQQEWIKTVDLAACFVGAQEQD